MSNSTKTATIAKASASTAEAQARDDPETLFFPQMRNTRPPIPYSSRRDNLLTPWEETTLPVGHFLPQYADWLLDDGIRAETIRQRVVVLTAITEVVQGALTPAVVLGFCRGRELSPGTTYQYHSVAAGFSKWLALVGLVKHDPFATTRRPPKPNYRARPAGTDELLHVLEHAREPMRSWAVLAAYAGLRCVEIARLSGRDLVPDAEGWMLRIPEGKGSKPGNVPAHPLIVELLRDAESGRVWPTMNAQKVSQRGNAEMRRLGVRCRMHQLRHAFATELYKQTRDVLTVQHALRHEQLETTARYIMFDDQAVRSAVSCLAFTSPTRVAREVAGGEHCEGDTGAGDGLGHVEPGKTRGVEDNNDGGAGDRAGDDLGAEVHGIL